MGVAPGLPGHSTRARRRVARAASSSVVLAAVVVSAGSRLRRSAGPLPRPPAVGASAPAGTAAPPPRATVLGAADGSGNADAPPGPARAPGHVGHGAAAAGCTVAGAGAAARAFGVVGSAVLRTA